MDALIQFIVDNAKHAPWVVFLSTLLAGLNVPISIDLLVAISAILAATTIPHLAIPLYLSLLVGCICSAWIAYWVGRSLGERLKQTRLFAKPLSEKNLTKMNHFYRKYGLWTYIIGRFIPFGVRNCIFMSTGMSRSSFKTFALRDGLACFIWASLVFPLFYSVGLNLDSFITFVKKFNIAIFSLFSVSLACIVWVRKRKKRGSNE